jgi:drug/metabolite transporter (DMT)-like permease
MSAFEADGAVASCRAPKRRPEDMASPVFSPRHEQIPLGILYMVASTLAFAAVNAVVKWEVALYPVGEVAFVRSLFSLIPCYLLTLPRLGFAVLRTERRFDHVKRALSQFCSMMSIFVAFQLMPLAGAIAISFSAPLFTTLLSILFLKERVGIHRWSALLVGFVGVLCVTRPGPGMLQSGAIFALSNAVLTSTVAVAIRRMSVTESIETLTFYQLTLIALFSACLLPLGFAMPRGRDALLMVLAGLGNGVAQYWWTKSLHLAPPSAVTPFNYLSLVWATIIGFLVWGDRPTARLLAGSAIVIGSGLYIVWRETVRRRERTLLAPQTAREGPVRE